jgi:hypothetical protein
MSQRAIATSEPAPSTQPSSAPTTRPGGPIVPPARRDCPGKLIAIPAGQIFLPDYYEPAGQVDVVLWFLGASWCVNQEFYDTRKNAAIFVANRGTIDAGFHDEQSFDALLSEISNSLGAPIGRIVVGSFSGGYVAVRDILKLKKHRDKIVDVVLADSLYPPRGVSDPLVLDEALAPFLDYARRAADGRCGFWFSQLYPPQEQFRTNGTTVSARWLIQRSGARLVPTREQHGKRLLLYRADLRGFHVMGFAGMTNQDHFEHLYNLHELLVETSLETAR